MTICIAVRVNECIVFAADSATTLSMRLPNGSEQGLVYRHGHKVFNLRKGLPICAMTYGTGNVGRASVSMLSKEFRKTIAEPGQSPIDPDTYTIEEVAHSFMQFLHDRYVAIAPPPVWSQPLGVILGGYSGGSDTHEIWKFHLETDGSTSGPLCDSTNGECGISFGGDPEAIFRLVVGYSGSFEALLGAELADPARAATIMSAIRTHTQQPLVWDAMPVQDAIDLATFLVDVTKGLVRFTPGHDTVGGETDIAVVTKYEAFKWVKRKHFFPSSLNL